MEDQGSRSHKTSKYEKSSPFELLYLVDPPGLEPGLF